jgi:hypothetical protein
MFIDGMARYLIDMAAVAARRDKASTVLFSAISVFGANAGADCDAFPRNEFRNILQCKFAAKSFTG